MAKRFTLGKDERLKSRKQIEKIFAEGKVLLVSPYRVLYLINKNSDPAQMTQAPNNVKFGVGVSAKNFKRAVERNKIKRLTRESWRLQKNDFQEVVKQKNFQVSIFFVYVSKELTDFSTIKTKVGVALKKLLALVEETHIS
jgi:ribonuclease P protein component